MNENGIKKFLLGTCFDIIYRGIFSTSIYKFYSLIILFFKTSANMSVKSTVNQLLSEEFLKFGIVGISGIAVDFFMTWLLKEKLKFNKYVANCAGFSFAVINNFVWNRYWTFHETIQPFTEQFLKFAFISIIGLAINLLLLFLFVKYTKMNFYIIKLMVIALVFFWNFSLNYMFTFR